VTNMFFNDLSKRTCCIIVGMRLISQFCVFISSAVTSSQVLHCNRLSVLSSKQRTERFLCKTICHWIIVGKIDAWNFLCSFIYCSLLVPSIMMMLNCVALSSSLSVKHPLQSCIRVEQHTLVTLPAYFLFSAVVPDRLEQGSNGLLVFASKSDWWLH
jgi:hypothetical protein